jgi:predicted nucleic acid-binding protein
MKKVFIDSSVLVAACASFTGASAYILSQTKQKKIKSYISADVIGEAKKNVFLKLDEKGKGRLDEYLNEIDFRIVSSPTPYEIAICEKYIFPKDAPILAAAIKTKCAYLITLDRKHFFQPQARSFAKSMGIAILTPRKFIR